MKSSITYLVVSIVFFLFAYTKQKELNNLKHRNLLMQKELNRTVLDWDACKHIYCDCYNAVRDANAAYRHKKIGGLICD